MSLIAKQYWSAALQSHSLDVIELVWRITAAGVAEMVNFKPEITFAYNAAGTPTGELGQTTIDRLIGSGIINASVSFGSTAMGTDAFGFVLSTKGQVDKLFYGEYQVILPGSVNRSFGFGLDYSVTSMPNTLPAATAPRFAKTSTGDIAGLFTSSGLDTTTSGIIRVNLFCKLK